MLTRRQYIDCPACKRKLAAVTVTQWVQVVQRTCKYCRLIWEIVIAEDGFTFEVVGSREQSNVKS